MRLKIAECMNVEMFYLFHQAAFSFTLDLSLPRGSNDRDGALDRQSREQQAGHRSARLTPSCCLPSPASFSLLAICSISYVDPAPRAHTADERRRRLQCSDCSSANGGN
jgi:hypothetical protein